MSIFAYYVHSLDPFIIRFPESWVLPGVRWYGVCYVLGFAIAALMIKLYRKKGLSPFLPAEEGSFMTYLIFGVLLGGRVGYCLLYDTERFFHAPWIDFELNNGGMAGMSSHGGFVGVALAILLFAYRYKKNPWSVADVIVSVAPPGLFLGRLANFINGELWGKVTIQPWGVIFPQSSPFEGFPLYLLPARHPSQLYEAATEGLLLGVYLQWRFWKGGLKPGMLTAEFLMMYSVLRIGVEFFREPDASLFCGVSRGIFYSIGVFLIGAVFWIWRRNVKVSRSLG